MTLKLNIYDQVTNAIIAELEKGIIPWNRPWINGTYAGAISHTTGKPYSFLNQMLLGCKGGEWLTYGQIKAEGGQGGAGSAFHHYGREIRYRRGGCSPSCYY